MPERAFGSRAGGGRPFVTLHVARALCALAILALAPAQLRAGSGERPKQGQVRQKKAGEAQSRVARFVQGENSRYHWGISVVDLESGEPVFLHNEGQLLSPASVMKVVSGYAALSVFGKDHRFTTELGTYGEMKPGGVLSGPLVVRGGGDPTLSWRFFNGEYEAPVRFVVDELLRQQPITRVDGDVVGDDSRFLLEPYGPSWGWEDFQWAYGVKVSALSINDNVVLVRIRPGAKPGDPVQVETFPSFLSDTVRCEAVTRTGAEDDDLVSFKPLDGDEIFLSGAVSRSAVVDLRLALTDPALTFARWVKAELERRGIPVRGGAKALHRTHYARFQPPEGEWRSLAQVKGRPLSDVLDYMLKRSVNLYAELPLRNMGVLEPRPGMSERQAGGALVMRRWPEIFKPGENVQMLDASGLARYDLVTPKLVTDWLGMVYKSADFEYFRDLLPLSGGAEGTLRSRLKGGAKGRVWGKTGQLGMVNSMAGYALTLKGRWMAFCMIVNNHPSRKDQVKASIDRFIEDVVADR